MVHFYALHFFFPLDVIEVLESRLHMRGAVSVGLPRELDLRVLLETAPVAVGLNHVVVVLLVLARVLVPQETSSFAFHAAHVNY